MDCSAFLEKDILFEKGLDELRTESQTSARSSVSSLDCCVPGSFCSFSYSRAYTNYIKRLYKYDKNEGKIIFSRVLC